MARYDLAAEARRVRNIRRRFVVLREIAAPAMLATDLYAACYRPVIDLWTEAAKRIVAEYERTLNAMTTDAPADLQAELDAADSAFQRLFLTLTPSLRDWTLRLDRVIRSRWRGAVLSATSVDLQTRLGPADVAETLEAAIARNVALIKDVNAQARARISDAVFRGLEQRLPARKVAAEIRHAVSLGRNRSVRIASHQLSSISAALAQERRREAGLSVFMWHHSAKRNPREEHLVRNGLLYSEDSSIVGKKVDGKTVRAAPARDDRAGVKPNCGCRERGVLVFEFD